MELGAHPLQHTWIIWEHRKNQKMNYEQNTSKLLTFNTVEGFWRFANHYPKPSKYFFNGKNKPNLVDYYLKDESVKNHREVSSISIFKEGILPKWEDPMNVNGAEIAIRKFKHLEELDSVWMKLCMIVIGDQFEHSSGITGIRVVDSSIPHRPLYRVEIWFDKKSLRQSIETEFREKLQLGPFVQLFYREHTNAVDTFSKPRRTHHHHHNKHKDKFSTMRKR